MLLPRMWAIAAVALVLPLCAPSAAEPVTRHSLQEAVEAAAFTPTASAWPAYADGADALQKDSLCLRSTNRCGPTFGCRSDVKCCAQHGQHTTVRNGLAATTAGHCQHEAYISIGAAPNVAFQSASIQCRLTRDAAACGPDDCGDLVLSGEGESTGFDFVVIEGPLLPELTFGCPRFGGKRRMMLPPPQQMFDDTTQQLLDAAREAGRVAAARGDAVVNLGENAVFYSGPIAVQSRTRATRWERGWYTFAALQGISQTSEQGLANLEASLGTLPRATAQDFNTYRFELYRDQERF